MFVSLLRKLISHVHPSGGNEREIEVRLRNNLRKFAELATHVEKNRRTFCVAEIAKSKRARCRWSWPCNLVSTNLLNVRWAYWLCFCRWWLEQWLASLSEWSGSPRSRLVESGGGTSFLENVLERWKNAGELSVCSPAVNLLYDHGTVITFIIFFHYSSYPLYCTSVALVIQSAVLTFLTDTLLLAVDPFVLDSLPALGFPLLGAVAITTVVSCASLPHYLFAGSPLPLFLVCSSHDTAQIAAAVFVIYALA